MTSNLLTISAFVITALSYVALRPLAGRVGLVDMPGGRKDHMLPTPLIGGVGIYIGTLCISLLLPIVREQYSLLLGISGFILALGVVDDAREVKVWIRIALHAAAAWVMAMGAGNQLQSLGDILFMGPLLLGVLAVPITVFTTVGVINAVNMSDGLDGLSGGLTLIALGCLSIVALSAGHSAMFEFSTILIFSLLAFLALNFRFIRKKSAKIYLGDAGSTLLGFILAWLVIAATQGEAPMIAPVTAPAPVTARAIHPSAATPALTATNDHVANSRAPMCATRRAGLIAVVLQSTVAATAVATALTLSGFTA